MPGLPNRSSLRKTLSVRKNTHDLNVLFAVFCRPSTSTLAHHRLVMKSGTAPRYTHVTHTLHTRYTHVTHTLHTRYTQT